MSILFYHTFLYGFVSQGLGTTKWRIWLAEMDIDRGLDFSI